MTRCGVHFWAAGLLAAVALAVPARAASVAEFKEIYDLLKANAGAVSEAELNRAAVEGLLSKLGTRAWLVNPATSSKSETNTTLVTSSAIFDDSYGYIRVGRVEENLPGEFAAALIKISATNKIKGLVIDLRFAGGTDYAAAVKVADQFLASEQPLLDWGQGMKKSTDKTNARRWPVAVLVNHSTLGAAEALAAVLRHSDTALLIGTNTAGQASITKDFPLSNGQSLRLAVAVVKNGDGVLLGSLKPDIRVDVAPDDELAYFTDAYKMLSKAGAPGVTGTNVASLTVTNKNPRRRLNEAELVRMSRDGESPEDETDKVRHPVENPRVIADPALARAIDLLKALAVVRRS